MKNSEFMKRVAAPPEIVSNHEFWKNKNVDWEKIQQNDEKKYYLLELLRF